MNAACLIDAGIVFAGGAVPKGRLQEDNHSFLDNATILRAVISLSRIGASLEMEKKLTHPSGDFLPVDLVRVEQKTPHLHIHHEPRFALS